MKGYVQVYTGDGKGKTTAAIGLAVRALGAGKRVCLLQFMKDKVYSEHKILPEISEKLTLKTFGKPFFIVQEGTAGSTDLASIDDEVVVYKKGCPPQDYVELIQAGMTVAKQAVTEGMYDVVILDEIIMALYFDLIAWPALKEIIDSRQEAVELVLTGRKAPQKLIEIADLVTEMKEIKHYYANGVDARLGIEH